MSRPLLVLRAVMRLRCPRCLEGRVFTGLFGMLRNCPACEHRFERAPGFFTGAMYVSYALAVPGYALAAWLVRLARPAWSDLAVYAAATVPLLAATPILFRYSRIVWMHLVRLLLRDP